MSISEIQNRILALVNQNKPTTLKSARSLHLTYLEAAYRYARVRQEEKSSDSTDVLAASKIAASMGLDKSTFDRCLDELNDLYGRKDGWIKTILCEFPELERIVLRIMSGGVPQPPDLIIACPPSVATSFMPKVLKHLWTGAENVSPFEKVRLEIRQTHDNERDIREMAAGAIRMKIVESYTTVESTLETESLKALGLMAERLFVSMPLGLVYPYANRTTAAVFAAAKGGPLNWQALSGQTFLLTHSYRIADALAELLPPPTAGGRRVYLTTLNNVRACLVTEGMDAIGLGVDPNLPNAFGHFSFNDLSDAKAHRFLRSNAVVSYSVVYPAKRQSKPKADGPKPKRTRRPAVDPLAPAETCLLRAMRAVASQYTHPFQS